VLHTDFELILGSLSVVLLGSILLSHSTTTNAKVVSFFNLYVNAEIKSSTIFTRAEQPKNMKKQ